MMPTRPPAACWCGQIGCRRHGGAWANDRAAARRVRGRALQRARARLFDRQPLCELCELVGRATVATIRDHRIPLAEGGVDEERNEQALCAPCHQRKSQREAQRGRGLGLPRSTWEEGDD